MNCSISGEVPEEPVVAKNSGLLFEKRLIERHILDYGKCPVTGEPLTMDDIVPVKTGKIVKPRSLTAASIPGMLGMFQNEWDALMLSNFALEQQLHTARQELSHALYQHDAACRVIARLKKERDEARSLLAQAERQAPLPAVTANVSALSNGKRASENEEMGPGGKRMRPGISDNIIAELTDCNAALSQQRKKRQIPPTLASVDALERYTQLSSHPLHKTNKPGITSLDISLSKDIVATGGVDSNAVLFDRTSGEILSTLSGHSKKITSVKFVAEHNVVLSGSADKTVRIWQGSEDGKYDCRHILKDHTAEVQAVTVHATNNYFVTASLDTTWCFYDLSSGVCLTQVEDPSNSMGYTSAAFHPDGLILGTGTTDATVRIWDVKSRGNVASFDGHTGAVTAISFSENGYFLATAAHDGVKLWDLRKLKNFRSFELYDQDTPTNSVDFDHSGSYLAIAGSDIRVYQVGSVKAEWNCIKTLPDLSGTGKATSVKFGPDASYLAVGSMDRNLRIFGLPENDGSNEVFTFIRQQGAGERGECLQNSKSNWESKFDVYKKWGLSEEQIWEAFLKYPRVMSASEDKIAKTMEFLVNTMGYQPSAIAKQGSVIGRNLEKIIVPRGLLVQDLISNGLAIKFTLSSLFDQSEESFLKRFVYRFEDKAPELLKLYKQKVDVAAGGNRIFIFIRQQGAGERASYLINKFGFSQESALKLSKYLRFKTPEKPDSEIVNLVKERGFNPLDLKFLFAVTVVRQNSKSNWESKFDVYKKWGLSEEQIWEAFLKYPRVMEVSEDKIAKTMEFLVNTMGYQPSAIAKQGSAIGRNLEKIIVPRGLLVQDLISNGLAIKFTLSSLFDTSEEYFLDRFVYRFEDRVPELLKLYKQKVDVAAGGKYKTQRIRLMCFCLVNSSKDYGCCSSSFKGYLPYMELQRDE
ncbi:hypothetical protein COLO4_15958 [Corchorus olitorius]|uniref:Pre-mRNA-processing factor 19 n=1 Tax=Corchorus olitorius TaxID=93759 RepID=A0A1R3JKQ8_9ROSI|nr:hypothetical protein COLO4_15958 [Corchorus olitorius]